DAQEAGRAIETGPLAPKQVVPFLKSRLRPVEALDVARVTHLLSDLDSREFAVRENAMKEVESLDERATGPCRKVLASKPSLELRRRVELLLEKLTRKWFSPSQERLQSLRALELLERIGTPEARQVLESLATGTPEARLTQEAAASINR